MDELKKQFDHLVVSVGDEELLTNVNDEYNFGPNGYLATDGFVNTCIVKGCLSQNEIYPITQTSIRGATYVIYYSNDDDTYTLYVNDAYLDIKKEEILSKLEQMKENKGELDYYLNTWRPDHVEKDYRYRIIDKG